MSFTSQMASIDEAILQTKCKVGDEKKREKIINDLEDYKAKRIDYHMPHAERMKKLNAELKEDIEKLMGIVEHMQKGGKMNIPVMAMIEIMKVADSVVMSKDDKKTGFSFVGNRYLSTDINGKLRKYSVAKFEKILLGILEKQEGLTVSLKF